MLLLARDVEIERRSHAGSIDRGMGDHGKRVAAWFENHVGRKFITTQAANVELSSGASARSGGDDNAVDGSRLFENVVTGHGDLVRPGPPRIRDDPHEAYALDLHDIAWR